MSYKPANHNYHDTTRGTPPGCPQCGTSGGVAERDGLVCATCGMPLEAPERASGDGTAQSPPMPSPAGPKHARPTPEGADARAARKRGA